MLEAKGSRIRVEKFVTSPAQYRDVFAPARNAILKRQGDINVESVKHPSSEGLIVRIDAVNQITLDTFFEVVTWRRGRYLDSAKQQIQQKPSRL